MNMENQEEEENNTPVVDQLPQVLHDLICNLLDRPTSDDPNQIGVKDPPKIVVFGGSKVGKSIVNNLILETLLHCVQHKLDDDDDPFVLHIELCFAQPDLGPPGTVSVSKVDCCGGHQILLSKFIGSMSPHDCYELYIRCLGELRNFIRNGDSQWTKVPWLIHTMQIFHGIGVRLGRDIVRLFQPTIIVRSNEQILDQLRIRPGSQAIISIDKDEPIFNKAVKKNLDKRSAKFIKYFNQHECPADSTKTLSLSTCGLGSMTKKVRYGQILESLVTGTLVALCQLDPKSLRLLGDHFAADEEDPSQNWRRQVKPSHPSSVRTTLSSSSPVPRVIKKFVDFANQFSNDFIGYGLVHCVNQTKHRIELLTPVQQELLDTRVNCILTTENMNLSPEFHDFAKSFPHSNKSKSNDDETNLDKFDESLPLPLKNLIANASSTTQNHKLLLKRTQDKLSQLTPKNGFFVLSQILKLGRHFDLKNDHQMSTMTGVIIQKMMDEPNLFTCFPAQVADFVCCVNQKSDSPQFEDELVESFLKNFVQGCQEQFEKPFLLDLESSSSGQSSSLQDEDKEKKQREKGIELTKLIGELFKCNLLTVGSIAKILNQLLDHRTELGYECICTFFLTAGQQLEAKLKKVEQLTKEAEVQNISGPKFGASQVQHFVTRFVDGLMQLLEDNQETIKLSATSLTAIQNVITQLQKYGWETRGESIETSPNSNPTMNVKVVTEGIDNICISSNQVEPPNQPITMVQSEDLQGHEVVYRRFRSKFKK